jgi:glycosyltransferase involved in cell wall biosynthesis
MKKLLFAINADWYYRLHWEERMTSELVNEYKVFICTSGQIKEREDKLEYHHLKLSRYSIGLKSNLQTFFNALRLLLKIKPDMIHSVTVKPNIMFGLLSLILRKSIIMTLPGLGFAFTHNSYKSKFIKKILLLSYRFISLNKKAFFVFENNEDMNYLRFKKICHENNSLSVPGSGVNINKFSLSPVPEASNGYQVLFAARMLKSKGLFELVEAVKILRDVGETIQINVAGIIDAESPDSITLGEIEKLSQSGDINWLGNVSDMSSLIASNHFVVLPTRYGEGIPRILIEASACGRPVISSNIGGCKEFVSDGVTGIILKDETISTLATAIKELCNTTLCSELGLNGRRRVEKYYTTQHIIEAYKGIYDLVQGKK